VQVVNEGISRAAREIDRLVQRFGRFYCKPIWIDHLVS
jgi:hypothetical protein